MRPLTSASLRMLRRISLDEAEHFSDNQSQRRFAPAVFTFGPEWCSTSLRNAVQLGRNPQQHVKLPSGELPDSVRSRLIHAVSMVPGVL